VSFARPSWWSRRLQRRVWRGVRAAVVIAALAVVVGLVYAAPALWRAARDGRSSLLQARDALARKDTTTAERSLSIAAGVFANASSRLSSPLVWPLRAMPVVSTHVAVARTLSDVGMRAAQTGLAATRALETLPGHDLSVLRGRVDLAAVRRAGLALGDDVDVAAFDISRDLQEMSSGWVVPPLAKARSQALDLLPGAADGMRKGRAALRSLPSVLGEGGRRRYLIAFSNLAELRGTGGLIGFVTVLRAENGVLRLEDFSGRPTKIFPPPGESKQTFPPWFPEDFREQAKIFQNINMTTDFPTVGRLIVEASRGKAGPLDGVISVDPSAIAAILRVIGPVSVPPWPTPVTAANAATVAEHDVYVAIRNNDRREKFFADLVRTTFGRFVSSESRLSPRLIGAFDAAVQNGHLRMYSAHPADQRAFEDMGLAGDVGRAGAASDVLGLVTENGAGNKGDWYLRRTVVYHVALNPKTNVADTRTDILMQNTAPASGLPDYIIGAVVPGIPRGTNRELLMFLRSPSDELGGFLIGDAPANAMLRHREGTLHAYYSSVDIPAQSSASLTVTSRVPNALTAASGKRTYRLRVLPQAVANPDILRVDIAVPKGWRAHGRTRYFDELRGDVTMEVALTQTRRAWVFEKLVLDPFRLARHLVGRIF
jgi:hypothetical protein